MDFENGMIFDIFVCFILIFYSVSYYKWLRDHLNRRYLPCKEYIITISFSILYFLYMGYWFLRVFSSNII